MENIKITINSNRVKLESKSLPSQDQKHQIDTIHSKIFKKSKKYGLYVSGTIKTTKNYHDRTHTHIDP